MKYLIVFVTCSDAREAHRIAGVILRKKMAACVNLIPGLTSFYFWKGKLTKSREILLLIKTTHPCFKLLKEEILRLHSYELPEIVAVNIQEGHRTYLEWLDKSTQSKI